MDYDAEKTFKFAPFHGHVEEAKRTITATAAAVGVEVNSMREEPGPMRTDLEVVISGHPKLIREFKRELDDETNSRANGGNDLIFDALKDLVVYPIWERARERWYARREPPLETERADRTGTNELA